MRYCGKLWWYLIQISRSVAMGSVPDIYMMSGQPDWAPICVVAPIGAAEALVATPRRPTFRT